MEMTTFEWLLGSGGVLMSLLTWLLGRRGAKVTQMTGELDNVEKALSIYRIMVEEGRAREEAMHAEATSLKEEICKVRAEMMAMSQQNIQLMAENRELRAKIDSLESKLTAAGLNPSSLSLLTDAMRSPALEL